MPYKVYVVVARDFGEQLAGLERGIPIWIVDSVANNPTIRRLWVERPNHDHLTGITAFNDVESASSTELLLSKLDSIDLHHGSYSASPPYTAIEIIGATLTEEVRKALGEFGFGDFCVTSGGFSATRSLPLD